jgi:hypothetical protein
VLLCDMINLYVNTYFVMHYDFWMRHTNFRDLKCFAPCAVQKKTLTYRYFTHHFTNLLWIYMLLYTIHTKCTGNWILDPLLARWSPQYPYVWEFSMRFTSTSELYTYVCMYRCVYMHIYVSTLYYFTYFCGLPDRRDREIWQNISVWHMPPKFILTATQRL